MDILNNSAFIRSKNNNFLDNRFILQEIRSICNYYLYIEYNYDDL